MKHQKRIEKISVLIDRETLERLESERKAMRKRSGYQVSLSATAAAAIERGLSANDSEVEGPRPAA